MHLSDSRSSCSEQFSTTNDHSHTFHYLASSSIEFATLTQILGELSWSWLRLWQSGQQRDTVRVLALCTLFCPSASHESSEHSRCHCISWKQYSFYLLCGQGLSFPPLSPEFCMQAKAAMWKRGLRGGGKGDWRRNALSVSVALLTALVWLVFSIALHILQLFRRVFVVVPHFFQQ